MADLTIDDIFEQIDHHQSRGTNFVVNHPVVKEMTKQVLEEKMKFNDNAVISEGTSYFGFFDPELLEACYVVASSRTSFHQFKSEVVKISTKEEARRTLLDKVAQRELCAQIGIFKNPRYLDVRKLFSDEEEKAIFKFVPKDFTNFPYDKILLGLGQLPRSYIFHNMVDGFRIRNSSSGKFTISGRGSIVKEADQETKTIVNPHERLKSFLEKLVEKNFSLQAIGYKGVWGSAQEKKGKLISAILSHQGNVYIKDARTAGGYMVVRVRKESGKTYIESDSPHFTNFIERRRNLLAESKLRYDFFESGEYLELLLDKEKRVMSKYDHNNTKVILRDLFNTLNNPMVEEGFIRKRR